MNGRGRLKKPRVLDRRVVDDEIHHNAHTELMGTCDQTIEGREVPEKRINIAVVRDVVAVVGLRRTVDRGNPHDVDAQICQVVQPLIDAL